MCNVIPSYTHLTRLSVNYLIKTLETKQKLLLRFLCDTSSSKKAYTVLPNNTPLVDSFIQYRKTLLYLEVLYRCTSHSTKRHVCVCLYLKYSDCMLSLFKLWLLHHDNVAQFHYNSRYNSPLKVSHSLIFTQKECRKLR